MIFISKPFLPPMKKIPITRRQMLKVTSFTALSAMASNTFVAAKAAVANGDIKNTKLPDSPSDLCYMNAVDMAALLRTKKISAREVMQAHLKQIGKVNSKVNAFITFVPEDQLMTQYLAADEALAKGKLLGPLHGLPFAVK